MASWTNAQHYKNQALENYELNNDPQGAIFMALMALVELTEMLTWQAKEKQNGI